MHYGWGLITGGLDAFVQVEAFRQSTVPSTYCIETGCAAVPVPGVVRTIARFAGEVVGTIQNSVLTSAGPSWYTTVKYAPAGLAPAFGTSATLNAPFAPSVAFVTPAATAAPLAVTKAGHVMIKVP
jgi:hypothetical protein